MPISLEQLQKLAKSLSVSYLEWTDDDALNKIQSIFQWHVVKTEFYPSIAWKAPPKQKKAKNNNIPSAWKSYRSFLYYVIDVT